MLMNYLTFLATYYYVFAILEPELTFTKYILLVRTLPADG